MGIGILHGRESSDTKLEPRATLFKYGPALSGSIVASVFWREPREMCGTIEVQALQSLRQNDVALPMSVAVSQLLALTVINSSEPKERASMRGPKACEPDLSACGEMPWLADPIRREEGPQKGPEGPSRATKKRRQRIRRSL